MIFKRIHLKRFHLVISGLILFGLITSSHHSVADKPAAKDSVPALTTNPLVKDALNKIGVLEAKMKEARTKDIDVTREETVLWFANQF